VLSSWRGASIWAASPRSAAAVLPVIFGVRPLTTRRSRRSWRRGVIAVSTAGIGLSLVPNALIVIDMARGGWGPSRIRSRRLIELLRIQARLPGFRCFRVSIATTSALLLESFDSRLYAAWSADADWGLRLSPGTACSLVAAASRRAIEDAFPQVGRLLRAMAAGSAVSTLAIMHLHDTKAWHAFPRSTTAGYTFT